MTGETSTAGIELKELINKGRVQTVALDGLDGSGKGSCADSLASRLTQEGFDCLLVEFPAYQLPWGQFLDHLLHENDEGLSMEDRMRVYALNRLETANSIQTEVDNIAKNSTRPIFLIFDRFVSSNVITAAAYELKKPPIERTDISPEFIQELYRLMWEVDSVFLESLGLDQTHIYIPMLEAGDTIKSILGDISRGGSDAYEREDIQTLSRELYLKLAEMYPDKFTVFSQYKGPEVRMSPQEVSNSLYELMDIPNIQNQQTPGKIFRLNAQTEEIDTTLVTSAQRKYQSDDLNNHTPEFYPLS